MEILIESVVPLALTDVQMVHVIHHHVHQAGLAHHGQHAVQLTAQHVQIQQLVHKLEHARI